MKTLLLILAFAGAAFGQCGPLVVNPTTGKLDCTGPTGTPGAGFTGKGTYVEMTASSPAAGDAWSLTDATSSGLCGAGGGTSRAICVWSGTAWVVTSGIPGGADTQIQFNDSAAFAGDAGLTWNKTTKTLVISRNQASAFPTLFTLGNTHDQTPNTGSQIQWTDGVAQTLNLKYGRSNLGGGQVSNLSIGDANYEYLTFDVSNGVWNFGRTNGGRTGYRFHYKDALATTGVTTFAIEAGAGQSTNNLQEWLNNSGTVLSSISSTGAFTGPAATITGSIVKANTPLTTKGDLWVTDGTSMHRLAVGTDGQALTADTASTDGVKWATISGGAHTQNTDTGTTQPTFQIDSGNSGPKAKNEAGVWSFRNAADNAYAAVKALSFSTDSAAYQADGAEQAAPTVATPTIYFDSTAHQVHYKGADNVLKGTTVTPKASATSNEFLTHIPSTGVQTSRALAAGDLPSAPVAINTGSDPCPTGTHCAFGITYKSGYVFNQQTAATRVYIDLPTAAAGLQWCIKNSVVGGTGAAVTGIITVKAATGDYINNEGTIGSSGGVLSSAGAAGDGACFVASAANHWETFVGKGTWAP